MKLYQSALFLSIISISVVATAANDDAEFQKWLQQEQSSLNEFKDARDKEFTSFLEKQWKEMEVFSGIVRDPTPKPVKIPTALPEKPTPVKPGPIVVAPKPDTKPTADEPVKVKPTPVQKPLPVIVKVPKIKAPQIPPAVVPKPIAQLPAGENNNVNFFGNKLIFSTDPKFHQQFIGKINSKSISSRWADLSKTKYEETVRQLSQYKTPLQLNDWGYALLVNSLSQKIYPKSKDEQNLFTWFMLLKSGYKARIAYNTAGVYILFPTNQKVYGAPYFTFNGSRYYSLGFDGSPQKISGVLTYDGDYPNTDSLFDMQLNKPLNTTSNANNRKLSFSFNRKVYNINVGLDKNVVDFFKTYPQLDIDLYFNSEVNNKIGTQLLTQLRPIINGKSEVDAINILLRFVQKSFKYQTDGKQFGKENYLFLEETIFYPYSDCEDRAVMFAWLARNLLKADVVGVGYPGHIAAAVHIKSNVAGDSLMHNGKKYIITDPTYINANMGQSMPDFKQYKPKVIPIKSL